MLQPWPGGESADSAGSGQAGEFAYQEIRPVDPVPAAVHRVIAEGMPVPRDGALLGWVSDRQALVLLSVYHGQPGGPLPGGPQIRVLPLVGSEPLRWPAFTVSPLEDGRLWEYLDRGELVDLAPVVSAAPGYGFWVPSQNQRRAGWAHGCVVIAATSRRPSSGCPRASTWTTGCSGRASRRRPRVTCSACLAPWTWPAGRRLPRWLDRLERVAAR